MSTLGPLSLIDRNYNSWIWGLCKIKGSKQLGKGNHKVSVIEQMVSFPYFFFSLQVFPGLDSKRTWSLYVHQVQTEGRGHSMGQEPCLSIFTCVSFVLSHSFPPLSPHTHTPTPHPHPGVMEAKPWGKGPSLSHNNLWSQEHMENPSGFCSLSVVSLLGTEGSHSCRNAQQSKYTKVHLSGPRTRGTVPVSWKMV